ncbi:hypothetical protein HZB02_01000 [Candidatus Woesearchaeota archaeon]|nr:hypothetical protein [Candidatus Woesearchaeota archaeon]
MNFKPDTTGKRAEQLSLSVVVIAAIALIVLVVLVVIFNNGARNFWQNANDCGAKGGECRATCGDNFSINAGKANCESPKPVCCLEWKSQQQEAKP